MSFTLSTVPGFADQGDAICAAEKPALGLILGRINSNAAFGMARLEVFEGWYTDGDTVALPTSGIDGYIYSRSELVYVWGPHATGNKASGLWASYGPPWAMWYAAYIVNQTTGAVSCATGYRGNPDHADRQANTKDGVLKVWTIAQRQRSTLHMSTIPYFTPHAQSEFATDAALATGLLTDLNESARATVVNAEVIYMGEFGNGATVAQPTSPADGYAYSVPEILWMTSLRWTMDDNGASPPVATVPDLSKGQLKGWNTSVSSARVVTTQVIYDRGGGSGAALSYNTGRVAVFAFCVRNGQNQQVAVSAKHSPWMTNSGTINGAYTFTGMDIATGVTRVSVTPGTTVRVTYISGVWAQATPAAGSINPISPAPGTWDASGDPSHLANVFGTGGTPAKYVNAVTTNAMMLGAWVDAVGQLVAAPFAVGNDSGVKTVPAGAVYLQLGINDGGSFTDNDGSITVQVVRSGGLSVTGNAFAEIDMSAFFPGTTLRASTMKQLEKNIEEAWCSPEFFGPQTHSHGDTIALPVSPIDGYAYSRAEVFYVWDISNTGPDSGDNHNRMTCESCGVAPTTGVVAINSYETSTSSDGWFLNHDGTLRVIVVAMRAASNPALTFTDTQPAAGVTNANPDTPSGSVQFNGV